MVKDISELNIWHRIINKLNESGIKYVIVGAAALVMHGLPRSTLDIDIYIPAQEPALKKLFLIAGNLNLQSEQKDILRISHLPKLFADQWICFSYKGQEVLDVFLANEEEFEKLYKNSVEKKDKSMVARVASLDDIAVMKKKAARPLDLADLELIREFKKYKRST